MHKIGEDINDTTQKLDTKTLLLHKIFLHNFYYKKSDRQIIKYYVPYKLYLILNKFDLQKDSIQTKLIFEIFNEYNEILNPKYDFSNDELNNLTIDERLRYEDIFRFNQKWPDNWKNFNIKEIENTKEKEGYSFDLGTIRDDFEEIIYIPPYEYVDPLDYAKSQLDSVINEISINKKYLPYLKLLKNGR